MALVLKDRVKETTTTVGTGTLTLAGAATGYQTFSTGIGNTNTTYYTIQSYTGSEWEVGIGTVSAGSLSRDTVLSSSTGAKVSFSAGTKDVFCTYPADKSVYEEASGAVILPSTITSTGITTPSVTATTTDLTLSAISTGVVNVNTVNGTQVSIADGGTSTVNFWRLQGSSAGAAPQFRPSGADANIATLISSKGVNAISLYTNTFAQQQFNISHTASAVNYVQVTGASTGNAPSITTQGSDAASALVISTKGAGNTSFWSYGSTNRQFLVNGANASVNYHQVAGSVAGQALQYSAQGTDTNISMAFQPKGTGAIDLAAGSSGVNISNGGTVTAITRTAAGSAYTTPPTVAISAPTTAGGVQATATVTIGLVSVTSVANGGTGYTVNDVLTVSGGTFTVACQVTVTAVSSGVITAASVTTGGSYTVAPTNPASVTGGTGSSATFNLSFCIGSAFTITAAGSGYIEQPTITFSGGGGSGAAAYATVGSATTLRHIGGFHSFTGPSGISFAINSASGTVANYVQASSQSTGNYPNIAAAGTDASVGLDVFSKGATPVRMRTGTSGLVQFQASDTASAVNYVQVTGSATTGRPVIQVAGSDTNIGITYTAKGTGIHAFGNGNGTQLVLQAGSTSSVNRIEITPTVTGSAPILSAGGTDTDIDLALTPKGVGGVVPTSHAYFANATLTDGATISWAVNTQQVATITLGGNRTMAAPTNMKNGAFYALAVLQDATGSRTITWNAVFKWTGGTAPTLSTAASAKDYFVFRSDGTNLYEQGRSLGVA